MQSGSGHHAWGKADAGAGPGQWVTVIKGLETKANAGLGAQHDPRCPVGRPCDAGDGIQLLPLFLEGPDRETPDLC